MTEQILNINKMAVGMADLKIGKTPLEITTNLGSCIGVCIFSPDKKVGGMLHLMMPSSSGVKQDGGAFKKARYADTGIAEMIRQLNTQYGVNNKELKAKIFGGAKILMGDIHNIGADNDVAVRKILKDLGIPIVAFKTGGEKGYKITMDIETGNIKCQIFGEKIEEY